MPTISTSELPHPTDWNEFEDICADLFEIIWNDPLAIRHGRQGQRQSGVDILGHPDGRLAGVQCKGKRRWPPVALTETEVDEQVAEALKYEPPLTKFVIATTALNDAAIQDHVAAIDKRHREGALFSVDVLGWNDLSRKIKSHDTLIKKHFGLVALTSLEAKIDALPELTARIVIYQRNAAVPTDIPQDVSRSLDPAATAMAASSLAEALERDLARRYERALHRSLFPEATKTDEFRPLAQEVLDGGLSAVAPALRRRVLLRAARSAALKAELALAQQFLDNALTLTGTDSSRPAAECATALSKTGESLWQTNSTRFGGSTVPPAGSRLDRPVGSGSRYDRPDSLRRIP